jgi:putative peptidoglycan lipid II flippase
LNLTLIVALLGFHSHDPLVTARIQSIAVSVSGALQLAWLAWACRQNGCASRCGVRVSIPT